MNWSRRRKTAFEVRLQRERAAADKPRTVAILRFQEKINAAFVGRTGNRDRTALGQCDERLAGRIRVARERRNLRPGVAALNVTCSN
jgi:hypothetical protein